MANKDEPSNAGLVGHYVGCLGNAAHSRRQLPQGASKEAKKAMDDLIVALAGAAIRHVEMDKAQGAH